MTENQDVHRKTFAGLKWTGGSRLVQQVLQFGFTAVLARLLTPNDFGLMALLFVFTGFASLFVDFGFGAALVQKETITEREKSSAFWLNLALGAMMTLLLIAVSPLLGAFYNNDKVVPLAIGFSPAFLLGSLTAVQLSILQREMRFRDIALIKNVAFIGSNVVAMVLAIVGAGVWALVWLTLASGIIQNALIWIRTSWYPRLTLALDDLRDLWRFGGPLGTFNVLNYWATNADNLLIGRFVGTTELAFYSRAYSLMVLPVDLVSSVTTPVMLPTLSRLQGDVKQLKRIYLRAVGMIGLASFPTVIGLAVVAEPLVRTVYGPQWAPVVPLLQIFCVASALKCISHTTGWLYYATARTDWMLRWGMVENISAFASFAIGLPWGAKGIAISYACWNVVMLYPEFAIVGRLVAMKPLEVGRRLIGVCGAALAMGAVVWMCDTHLPESWPSVVELLVDILVGCLSYAVFVHIISPLPYRDFRALVIDRRRTSLRTKAAES